jgi:hypothetical protein
MFPNWFTPWSWPPLYIICMYEFHSAFIFLNDYSVSKLLFTMIFSIVRIPFLIFFFFWWWWISFVNSHFVRSKTYCCCWHCIEVMEFETHTHTLLEWIPIVGLCSCNNDSITTHTYTHIKYRSPFLLPTADMVVRCCAACLLPVDFKAQEKRICSIHKHRL